MSTRLHFTQEGLIAQCVFDLFYAPGTDLATVKADLWDNIKVVTSNDLILERITLDGTGQELVVNETGDISIDALPPTNAALVTKQVTGSRNGRFFWPGIPESDVGGNGRFNTFRLAAWNTAVAAAHTALTASGVVLRVIDSTQTVHVVDGLALKPYIGTQRRRLHN